MRNRWRIAALAALVCGSFGSVAGSQSAPRAHAPRRDVGPPRETRWYGVEPHVPLARVAPVARGSTQWAIDSAPAGACGAWAQVGARWVAVDRWGQVVRASRLVSRDYYDATGCHETTFDADETTSDPGATWRPGRAVLYARGGYRPRASTEWAPSPAERAEHERFVAALSALVLVPRSADGGRDVPLAERTLFFRFRDPNGDASRAPRERHLAASGGRMLVIAERGSGGRWVAVHVVNQLGNAWYSNDMPYRPVAVLDMNDDRLPEVVYHDREGGGEFFGDAVLSLDNGDRWSLVARSVGGSTA